MKPKATQEDKKIGERLRAVRKELGLTQEQIASDLGVSFQQIQKYETGQNRITASKLIEFTNRYDLDFSIFDVNATDLDKSLFLMKFNKLDKEKQGIILDMMKSLSKKR